MMNFWLLKSHNGNGFGIGSSLMKLSKLHHLQLLKLGKNPTRSAQNMRGTTF
jgi:hypothetical protein